MNEELTKEDLLNLKNCKKVVFNKASLTFDSKENEYKYVYDTARFKLFFYDYCKIFNWNNYISKYKKYIVRIYTDSFLLNARINKDDPSLNTDIGMIKRELMLEKGLVYKNVTHSFKTKPVEGAYLWNKTINKYEPIPVTEEEEEEEEEDSDSDDDSEYFDSDWDESEDESEE